MDKEKVKKHSKIKVFFSIIAIGIIVMSVYLKVSGNNILDIVSAYRYKNLTTKITGKVDFDADSKSSFAIVGESYAQCTKDGIKYYGENSWSETYTMANPIMLSEGNTIAVGEIKNRTVHVFNEKGKIYSAQTEAGIVQFAINKIGYLAIITKSESGYKTNLYNQSGVLLTSIVNETKEIFPSAIDISDDGKYAAISYLDTTTINYSSKILFFDIENENEYVDSINYNATIQKKGEAIILLAYREEGKLAVVSDKAIMLVDYNGKELWSKVLSNDLTAVELDNKKNIVLALGDEAPGGSEYKSGTVLWFDLKGNMLGSYGTNEKIKTIEAKGNRILVYGSKTIFGLSDRGDLLWKHTVTQDVDQILLYNNLSSMFLTYRNSAEIISINSKEYGDK